MNIIETISKYFANVTEYITTEVELVKLKMTQRIGSVLGIVFSGIFLMLLFHITIALVGVWLGLVFSEVLDSNIKGFGITLLVYIAWFITTLFFSKQLLIRPLSRVITSAILAQEETEKSEKLKKDEEASK